MTDKQKGLYQKYKVERNDGKEITQGCFVLELKDPKARQALLIYANEVEKEGTDKDLAYDLRSWVGKYEPAVATSDKKDVMLFDRLVLINNAAVLDEDSLYIIPTDDLDEYKSDDDIVLPAVVSVDMQLYNKFHEEKATREKELEATSDPLLDMAVSVVITDYESTEYIDFGRFWEESSKQYKALFKNKYDLIGEKAKLAVASSS